MMIKNLATCFLISALALSSCDCMDCEPLKSEPKVKVRFFDKSTLLLDTVFIESVNDIGYTEIKYFGDTADLFYFPLNISATQSSFDISYRSNKNWDSIMIETFSVDYAISTIRTEENITKFQASDIEAAQSTFDSVAVFCKNSECIDENTTINIYR